jgi:flagellar capping protein FliD
MSGIDTDSMFTQLEAAMRKPLELYENRIKDYEVKLSAYSTLQNKLSAMKTAAQAMDTSTEFMSLSASSEDSTIVSATATSTAVSGSYEIKVNNLAKSHSIKSAAFGSADIVGSGTMTIQVGNDSAVRITIGSNATLSDVASAINGASGIGVNANVIYDGTQYYYLMLTGKNQGDNNIIDISVDDDDSADNDALGLSQLSYENYDTKLFDSPVNALNISDTITINAVDKITVTSDMSLQDIARTINNRTDWTGTQAKAVVVSDNDTGRYFLRVDGVSSWQSLSPIAPDYDLNFEREDGNVLTTNPMFNSTAFGHDITINGVNVASTAKDIFGVVAEINKTAAIFATPLDESDVFSSVVFETNAYDSSTTALNITDSMTINGNVIAVTDTMSLQDIADKVNDTGLSATILSNGQGKYFLRVDSEFETDAYDDYNTTELGLTPNIEINGTTIPLVATDKLQDVATKINAAGLIATCMQNSEGKYFIKVAGVSTMADNFTAGGLKLKMTNVTSYNNNSSLAGDVASYVTPKQMSRAQLSQHASITLNDGSATGITIKNSSNTISSALPGVGLTLKQSIEDNAANDKWVTITVDKDATAIVEKVNTFVTAYNDLADFFTEYQGRKDPDSADSKTLEEGLQDLLVVLSGDELPNDDEEEYGPLMGDSTTDLVKLSVNNSIYRDISGLNINFNNLSDLGITLNYGKLEVNTTTLNSKIIANADAVADFFTKDENGVEGFAVRMITTINNLTERYKANSKGILITRVEGLSEAIVSTNDTISRREDGINAELERMRSQFNSLELLMGKYQSTSNYLATQISSMG